MARDIVAARFAPGVHLDAAGIVDESLGQAYPVSASARMYLSLVGAGVPLAEIERRVVRTHGLPPALVYGHLRDLVCALNRAMLLNLQFDGLRGRLRWLWWLVVSAALLRRAPPLRNQRWAVRTSLAPAHVDVARGVGRGMAHWWLALAVAALALALGTPAGLDPLALVPALPAAIVSHEAAHAFALGRRGGRGFLVVTGLSAAVVHSRAHSGLLVHAAGPLCAGAWGAAVLAVAVAAQSEALALASVPFVAQTITLTVLAADGRLLMTTDKGRPAEVEASS